MFWVLLLIAISAAIWLTIRDLKRQDKKVDIRKIPVILDSMGLYLKGKIHNRVERISFTPANMLKLNDVLIKCMWIYGVTTELLKPKSLKITNRYRQSIERRIPVEKLKQLDDADRSWELNMQVGGILDSEKYGLQTEEDKKYQKLRKELNNITKQYIGEGSQELTNSCNDYIIRMYATYSYLLFMEYYGVLRNFAKLHGVETGTPDQTATYELRQQGIDKYLSEELEKVKICIANALSSEEGYKDKQ
jgi:hypothetical protein